MPLTFLLCLCMLHVRVLTNQPHVVSDPNCSGAVISSYGAREAYAAAAAATDPYLGHSIGPVPGYGVSRGETPNHKTLNLYLNS